MPTFKIELSLQIHKRSFSTADNLTDASVKLNSRQHETSTEIIIIIIIIKLS